MVPGKDDSFVAAYDAALDGWARPHRPLEVSTPYGVTRVNACGPTDGPPLVLLHGGGATSTVWGSTIEAMNTGRHVLAVDVMGDAGRSMPDGTAIRTAEDHVGWLDAVLDAVGADSVDLCGHSYGGWLALNFALRRTQRVRRLALVAPSSCFAGLRIGYLVRAVPRLVRPTARRTRAFLTWEAAGRPLDEAWLEVAALGSALTWSPLVRPRRPRPAEVGALTVPTLLVLAERDRSHDNTRVERVARELLAGLTVTTLPGATHHSTPASEGPALGAELDRFLGPD